MLQKFKFEKDAQERNGVPVVSLYEYFTHHETLIVPSWQREYSWLATDEGQVGQLLEDFKLFINGSNDSDEYLLGALILCQKEPGVKSWQIVDGQQRTLTLALFLMAAARFTRKYDIRAEDAGDTQVLTQLTQCVNASKDLLMYSRRINMKAGGANEALDKVFEWSTTTAKADYDLPEDDIAAEELLKTLGEDQKPSLEDVERDISPTQENIFSTANYIFRYLERHPSFLKKSNFLAGLRAILHRVNFIELTLDDEREALSVYDRINDRGLLLNSADLVKNQLFIAVDSDEDWQSVEESWGALVKSLQGASRAALKNPKFLMRLSAIIEARSSKSLSEVVDFWKERIAKGKADPVELAKDFAYQATVLRQLSEDSQSVTTRESGKSSGVILCDSVSCTELYFPLALGQVQHLVLPMSGLHLGREDTVRHLMQRSAHRALLSVFAQEQTGLFMRILPKLAAGIRDLNQGASPSDVDKVFADFAYDETKPETELRSNLASQVKLWSYKNLSSKKKMRVALALLNLQITPVDSDNYWTAPELLSTKRPTGKKFGWQLDHIYAQSLTNEHWVDGIGNICLLAPGTNRFASNALPSAKRNTYADNNIMMTKVLAGEKRWASELRAQLNKLPDGVSFTEDLDTWGKDAIASRTESIVRWLEFVLVDQYSIS